VALSALLSAAAVAPKATAEALVDAVVRGAVLSTAGGLSAQAAALADGVIRTMFTGKLKVATAVLLALGLAASSAGVLAHQALAPRERPPGSQKSEARSPEPAAAKEAPKSPAASDKDTIVYGGRVLGPNGRPVSGAKLHMTDAMGYTREPCPSPEFATTGPDGRFRFRVPKAQFGNHHTVVAAAAAKHGAGWVDVPADGKRDDLTVQLVRDDVPITGQVVDLEGKPVPGATLTVLQINADPEEDLGPWLEAVKRKKGLSLQLEQEYLKRFTVALSPKVTTDAAGRFRLGGIGRNRLVIAHLDGPGIASQELRILTRPGRTIEVTEEKGDPEYGEPRKVTTYYGANFRHAAAPTRPIVGVVRDKDTKEPLAGVTIRSYARATRPGIFGRVHVVRTRSDAEGRYRLTGMPKGEGYKIVAIPGIGRPYVATHRDVPDGPGLGPVTVDFELKRGVWIEGKITDGATGKPVPGSVEYFSLESNPNLRDYPGFDSTVLMFDKDAPCVATKEDGSYRVVGLPGTGLLAIRCTGRYLPPDWDSLGLRPCGDGLKLIQTAPYCAYVAHYNTFAPVDAPRGVAVVKRAVALDPGWTFTGTVLGPDGKPLAGARSIDLTVGFPQWSHEGIKGAEFTVSRFNPRRPRDLLFQHLEKGLVGVAQPAKENGGSVTVRMEPGATVTGRLVDADGRPRAGVELRVWFHPKKGRDWEYYSPDRIKTDREGRFRIEALFPGSEFRLAGDESELHFGDGLRSGQMKDLGDVQLKPLKE
jgi:protocatechuate 3,4-dioxygenase beta subunit